ncbi:hypothetical protein HDV03_003409 [Kappamyces sp. JEL0829]|nr:hypothetical protein HDV03_003409 [Kappamyces sp. JEL0829]
MDVFDVKDLVRQHNSAAEKGGLEAQALETTDESGEVRDEVAEDLQLTSTLAALNDLEKAPVTREEKEMKIKELLETLAVVQETRCHLCRADHDPIRCPLSSVCYWCFRRGHDKSDCKTRHVQKYCQSCKTSGHATQECDIVWRCYIVNPRIAPSRPRPRDQGTRPVPYTADNKPFVSEYAQSLQTSKHPVKKLKDALMPTSFSVSCYWCASPGHFGDFCPQRNGRVYPTAFDLDHVEIAAVKDRIRTRDLELRQRTGEGSQKGKASSRSSGNQPRGSQQAYHHADKKDQWQRRKSGARHTFGHPSHGSSNSSGGPSQKPSPARPHGSTAKTPLAGGVSKKSPRNS